jgi:hypothetical protein
MQIFKIQATKSSEILDLLLVKILNFEQDFTKGNEEFSRKFNPSNAHTTIIISRTDALHQPNQEV